MLRNVSGTYTLTTCYLPFGDSALMLVRFACWLVSCFAGDSLKPANPCSYIYTSQSNSVIYGNSYMYGKVRIYKVTARQHIKYYSQTDCIIDMIATLTYLFNEVEKINVEYCRKPLTFPSLFIFSLKVCMSFPSF